jgi:signal transduction histidine kinase
VTADRPLGNQEHHGLQTPHGHPGDAVLRRLEEQRFRLQLVASALSQPLDTRGVAVAVLEAACNVLGASQGWVALVTANGASLELQQAVGFSEAALADWRRVPLTVPVPMTRAVVSGRPIYHRSAVDRDAEFPLLAASRKGAPEAQATAVVPFVFEGRGTGVLSISFPEQREFDSDERWFLESLATQASQAIERARLFDELREREARLESALEASGTGTWDWDLVTGTLVWSDQVFRLHALPETGSPPTPEAWLEMVHDGDRARIGSTISACLEQGGTYDAEFRIRRADGRVRWLHSVGRTAAGPDGRPARLLGTTLDITERREAEEERARQVEAEREAARLRDAFTGVVSHELRTPITTIYGGTRVLARRWRDMEPETRDGILADVVAEADRLYRLVEDLLVLTRVERGALDIGDEPLHLGRIVERVVASERPRLSGVEVVCEVPADLPSVAGEETYVDQVLRNLLDNAAKYGGTGSTVLVQIEAAGRDVVLRVLDEGPGVDETEDTHLFELFYRAPTTAATVAGAGIGLFVCRQLVEAMGGTIRAERRREQGSAFIVTLPRYEDDDAA